MDAEKNGLITVTLDPPMMLTTSGWEKDLNTFLNDANLMMQMIPSVPMVSHICMYIYMYLCIYIYTYIYIYIYV
jgi:hypothetical protein